MADFFKGFEELVALAKELEAKSQNGELKTNIQFSSSGLSSIPREKNYRPSSSFKAKATPSEKQDHNFEAKKSDQPIVGGLDKEVNVLRDAIGFTLKKSALLNKIGLEPTRGILLVGPPGTGKTLVAKTLAKELNVNHLAVTGPELIGKYYGEAEQRLRSLFDQAKQQKPCIVLIDEIDSLVPSRDSVEGEVEKRIVAQLLGIMDGFEGMDGVVVLATTNRPNAIDPALRRPGRFDKEVIFGVPDRKGRVDILKALTKGIPLDNVNFELLAERTPGLVGADLKALCQAAVKIALKKVVPSFEDNVAEDLEVIVGQQDFEYALNEIKPSSLRSLEIELPNVKWADIGGHDEIKSILQEATEGMFKYSDLYRSAKVLPPKGILLYGEPGTGKTLLAKAVAAQAEANFININGPEIMSKFIGQSEEMIRQIFERARQASPCVVFIDEIDTLAPARGSGTNESGVVERVVGQLLTEIDGMKSNDQVLLMCATNRPDVLDPALKRSGRLDIKYRVELPNEASRLAILNVHNAGRPLQGVKLEGWAECTEGWNGADLALLANAAALNAVQSYRQQSGDKPDLHIGEEHYSKAHEDILRNQS